MKTSSRLIAVLACLLLSPGWISASGTGEKGAGAKQTIAQTPDNFQVLVDAAQREKELNLIGADREWVNYGEAIDTFTRKYGIRVNELSPSATPDEELEILKSPGARSTSQTPDVVDFDVLRAEKAKSKGLLGRYRVLPWGTIPAAFKDPDGFWQGSFYGILAFEVNTGAVSRVPRDWADLRLPEFKGCVAIGSDPHSTVSAALTVMSASMANGGTVDDLNPGLRFFRDLYARGNFVPLLGVADTVISGATPVTPCWDYDGLADRDKARGRANIEVVIPASGVVGLVSVQAVNAFAPHPMAARLWMEFLASDEGQLIFLKGHAHPSRLADLEARGAIPPSLAEAGPPAASLAKVRFPTAGETESALVFVRESWDEAVTAESALREAPPAAAPTAAEARTAERPSGVVIEDVRFDDLFPVFYKYYDDHPIGSALATNRGELPAQDVRVDLLVKGYMTERKQCEVIPRLAPGESRRVRLFGLFTEDVLKLTEGTKALVNVGVRWTAGRTEASSETVQTLRFLRRNSMTWEDDRRAAAFVTAADPTVMRFAKAAAGLAAAEGLAQVNEPMQKAMVVHAALAQHGVTYVVDPASSYAVLSRTRSAIDFLQFPSETLDYKAGDCDDLSILHAALLEAVGVQTAFVTVPGHLFIAVSLGLAPLEARRLFLKADALIYADGAAWLPIEVTEISGGFLKAWSSAAAQWRLHAARGDARLVPMHDAWKVYEPVAFSSPSASASFPAPAEVAARFRAELDRFVQQELAGRVPELEAEISARPQEPGPLNALGVLYARYGQMGQAARAFAGVLERGEFPPALVNTGHLAFLRGDARTALEFYERALKVDPQNVQALLGAARANHELENYGAAREMYAQLKARNPALASEYSYLLLRAEEATRGGEPGGLRRTVPWYE